MQPVKSLECRCISRLGQPDGFRFRHLSGCFGSSHSGHATREDASIGCDASPGLEVVLAIPVAQLFNLLSLDFDCPHVNQINLTCGSSNRTQVLSSESRWASSSVPNLMFFFHLWKQYQARSTRRIHSDQKKKRPRASFRYAETLAARWRGRTVGVTGERTISRFKAAS